MLFDPDFLLACFPRQKKKTKNKIRHTAPYWDKKTTTSSLSCSSPRLQKQNFLYRSEGFCGCFSKKPVMTVTPWRVVDRSEGLWRPVVFRLADCQYFLLAQITFLLNIGGHRHYFDQVAAATSTARELKKGINKLFLEAHWQIGLTLQVCMCLFISQILFRMSYWYSKSKRPDMG